MTSDFRSNLSIKLRDTLLDKGYSVKYGPELNIEGDTIKIDLQAEYNGQYYLIEVNNGVRVGLNNIADLIRYSKYLKDKNMNNITLIVTNSIEKVDEEVKKIANSSNIKIITFIEVQDKGL